MKRKFYFLTIFLLATMLVVNLFGCKPKGTTEKVTLEFSSENMIVMTIVETKGEASALSALTKLKKHGKVDFDYNQTASGAFITSINGRANTNEYYWMLYTSDEEFSTTEYGTVDYNGQQYGQASYGADSLVVKEGEIYIWAYTALM